MSDAYKSTCHSHSTYKLFAIVVVGTSLVAQTVKNQPAMWETSVRSQSWEDPLEESMATYSSTLAWRIPWTEELGRLQLDRTEITEQQCYLGAIYISLCYTDF